MIVSSVHQTKAASARYINWYLLAGSWKHVLSPPMTGGTCGGTRIPSIDPWNPRSVCLWSSNGTRGTKNEPTVHPLLEAMHVTFRETTSIDYQTICWQVWATPALRRSCYFQVWILLLLSPLSSLDKNSLLYWTFSITSLIVTRCCQLYSNQRLLQGTFCIWRPLCEAPCEVLLNMKSQRGTGMARKPHATKNNQVMPNFKSHHEVKKQWVKKF